MLKVTIQSDPFQQDVPVGDHHQWEMAAELLQHFNRRVRYGDPGAHFEKFGKTAFGFSLCFFDWHTAPLQTDFQHHQTTAADIIVQRRIGFLQFMF